MRRSVVLALLALVLGFGSARAQTDIGVGAFGGMSFPIVNDLSSQGSIFGARVPVRFANWVSVEGFYAASQLGDVDEEFGGTTYTRDGGEVSAFGANVLFPFGEGVKFFPYVGLGSYSLKRDGADDIDDLGLNFGLGVGFPVMPKLFIDLRGEFSAIITDETSQKFGNVTVGASYFIF